MPNFAMLPPEINSVLMFTGAGSAPMLDAATAWDGLAAEVGTAASSFSSVTSGLAGQAWQGAASAAMLGAAAPYARYLVTAAAKAVEAAGQARAAVSVFEAARAATIPPLAVVANRNSLVQLVVSNVFGQNAPAIAAVEGIYEEMWAADVAAMAGYHAGASAAVAALPGLALPPGLQQFLAGLPNLGNGNLGNANIGNGNIGFGNLGFGNSGEFNSGLSPGLPGNNNVGGGNNGNSNVGGGNIGDFNIGFGNHGVGNVGFGNAGPVDLSSPSLFGFSVAPGDNNMGIGNTGNNNVGLGNLGDGNFGGGNTGNANIGAGNTGNNNFGFGNTGNNNIGIGLTGENQVGINLAGLLNSGQRQHRFR